MESTKSVKLNPEVEARNLGLIGLRSCGRFGEPPTKWIIAERKIKSFSRAAPN
jgi:hypothetical protein